MSPADSIAQVLLNPAGKGEYVVMLKVLRSNICIIRPFSLQPLTKYLLVTLPESAWLSIDTRKCRVVEFWDPWSISQAHGGGRAESGTPQSAFVPWGLLRKDAPAYRMSHGDYVEQL